MNRNNLNNDNLNPGYNEFQENPELYQNTIPTNMETNMNSNDNNLLERNYDIDNQYIECIPE